MGFLHQTMATKSVDEAASIGKDLLYMAKSISSPKENAEQANHPCKLEAQTLVLLLKMLHVQ